MKNKKAELKVAVNLGSSFLYAIATVLVYGELKADSNTNIISSERMCLCQKAVIIGEWPKDISVSKYWQVQKDQIIAGNLYLYNCSVDVNGKSLTVKGDLYQDGTLHVNAGNVHVVGNYSIGEFINDGYLKMINAKDYILIDGNFLMATTKDHTNYLTAGLMEIKGDFRQALAKNNFIPAGTHTVKLSGTKVQNISFDYPDISKFNTLILTKPLNTGYVFNETPVWNTLKQETSESWSVDSPTSDIVTSGTLTISGWYYNANGVSKIEVLVDGKLQGSATYGLSRPDVPKVYPEAGDKTGFSYKLDTTKISDGSHDITVMVTGIDGVSKQLKSITVSIKNQSISPDINGDGAVNMLDVMMIATCFNTLTTDSTRKCDLNSDGAINMADVIILALKFNTLVEAA